VLDMCLCDTAGIATGERLVYGKRHGIPEPASASNIPISRANPAGDAVLDALKMMLLGTPLNEVLTSITRLMEAHSKGTLCSILLVDEDGLHLRYGVAENLPQLTGQRSMGYASP